MAPGRHDFDYEEILLQIKLYLRAVWSSYMDPLVFCIFLFRFFIHDTIEFCIMYTIVYSILL